jgi:tRNA-dihydrouridine synthase
VALARELKARGIDVVDCSSGGIAGSATAARIKRTLGFQVPYAERVRREAGIATMAVGLIIEPEQAEAILEAGQADLIAIGRQALFNPNWPLEAQLALGAGEQRGVTHFDGARKSLRHAIAAIGRVPVVEARVRVALDERDAGERRAESLDVSRHLKLDLAASPRGQSGRASRPSPP